MSDDYDDDDAEDDYDDDDNHLDIDVRELVSEGNDDKVFARWKLFWLQEVILTKGGMVHLHDDDYDDCGDDDDNDDDDDDEYDDEEVRTL